MTEGFTGIIDQLERQKAAIERALAALREVDAPATATQVRGARYRPAPSRKRSTAAAEKALAQKARWAKSKARSEPPAPSAQVAAKPKRRISAEGMKRIIAATKKRWRLQKAAAKSASAKKVAVKKAVVKAPPAKAAKKVAAGRKATVGDGKEGGTGFHSAAGGATS